MLTPYQQGGCDVVCLPERSLVVQAEEYDRENVYLPSHQPDQSFLCEPNYGTPALFRTTEGSPYYALAYDTRTILYKADDHQESNGIVTVREIAQIAESSYTMVDACFSGDLFAGGYYGGLVLMDIAQGGEPATISCGWMMGKVELSRDGRYLIACDLMDNTAYVFSVESRKQLIVIHPMGRTVDALGFTMASDEAVVLYTDGSAQYIAILTDASALLAKADT